MGKRVGLKEAASKTGLSIWELRTGAKSGKYPNFRVGGPRGRIVFDIDLLENHIKTMMMNNVKDGKEFKEYGTIRKVE